MNDRNDVGSANETAHRSPVGRRAVLLGALGGAGLAGLAGADQAGATPSTATVDVDTAANWATSSALVGVNTVAFESDTGLYRLGDGAWNAMASSRRDHAEKSVGGSQRRLSHGGRRYVSQSVWHQVRPEGSRRLRPGCRRSRHRIPHGVVRQFRHQRARSLGRPFQAGGLRLAPWPRRLYQDRCHLGAWLSPSRIPFERHAELIVLRMRLRQ